MTPLAMGATAFLHLRFEDMPDALLQFVSDLSLVLAKHRPVVIVEILDDLECPTAVENIAADDLRLEPVGNLGVSGFSQLVAAVTQQQVGVAHELMK